MPETSGAALIAKTLKELGVEWTAGIFGSGQMHILNETGREGIGHYSVRHEQTGAYMADGWARTARKPGVCTGGSAPGIMNMVPGVAHAYGCMSPLLVLAGTQGTALDGLTGFQVSQPGTFEKITKWSQRVTNPSALVYWLRKAYQDAIAYPPGPVALEIPWDVSLIRGELTQQHAVPAERLARIPPSAGDPVSVEQAVELLLSNEEAMIIAGDGVYWSDAAIELKLLVEHLQVPVNLRRMARGSIPETHSLAVKGGDRQPLVTRAKVIMLLGMKATYLDEWFEPPSWRDDIKYIQVNESSDEIFLGVPTDVCVLGGVKNVLRQMVDCARDLHEGRVERPGWTGTVREVKEAKDRVRAESAQQLENTSPIHPDFLAAELARVSDDTATFILDGFTASGFITERVTAKVPGQVLDSGTHQGFGHGVGMAMGAQLARPDKQIVCFIGDGGIGIGGMEIETAARYGLPVVLVVSNNSSYVSKNYRPIFYPDWEEMEFIDGIRYDDMFRSLGCHVEHVTDAGEIGPALERSFRSGKTSVVNVPVDDRIYQPMAVRVALMEAWSRGGEAGNTQEATEVFSKLSPREVMRAHRLLVSQGLYNVRPQEIAETASVDISKLEGRS